MSEQPPIKVYRQRRASMMMRAIPGMIEVYIPYQLDETHPMVREFIANGVHKLRDQVPEVPPEQISREAIKALVADYAKRMKVNATRVQFRDMRRKWGSCSSKGTITLNTRLTWLDPAIAEYIVCHELAHLIELNHSPRFWAIVAQYMPDYQRRLQRLRELERTLW